MGSSSKKYKEKEKDRSDRVERKRRHRSPSEDESPKDKRGNKHRRHHHRERKRDGRETRRHDYESNDSDVVEISDREASPPPTARHASPPHTSGRSPSPAQEIGSGQGHDSLSIEETNKLRAKLGLKPLQVDTQDAKSDGHKDDGKKKDDWGEFYHKPAGNIAHTTKTEKLKTKLSTSKEKRKIEAKLSKVKTLGESDSDDDPSAWVSKNRHLSDAKKKAQQRAKALEELDEQFGVSDTIEKERKTKIQKKYTEKNLQGLQVLHDVDAFKEGKTVVLTLKDQGVLEEDDDVLVNVNMEDDERYKKNIENKTKKVQYNPYDIEDLDEWGNPKPKNLLHKYDEEIDGLKKDSFQIGSYETTAERKQSVLQNIKEKLANKRIECLPASIGDMIHLASDYYNEEELAQFKKPKKKFRKIRQKDKMLTADDLEVMYGDKKTKKEVKLQGVKNKMPVDADDDESAAVDYDDFKMEEKDDMLERALHKARRLKQRETVVSDLIKEHAAHIKPEIKEEPEADSGNIILNTTAEFCRTLGDIPTYGKAGNREEIDELMDYDKDLEKSDSEDDCQIVEEASTAASNWTNAEASASGAGADPILDAEPDVGIGVGAALKLAMSKGYLDKEESNRPSNSRLAYLQAKHYSIEDKNYGEEDRGNRRERYAGPVQDFRENQTFKPNVKLEYIDDDGHVLNSKEAFRYLSHKFHGKGPGKNKIEKRLKKSQQEGLMKKMSSTDTPLGTLNMLQAKQKEMQSPYIVLSGGKTHSTSISKARR